MNVAIIVENVAKALHNYQLLKEPAQVVLEISPESFNLTFANQRILLTQKSAESLVDPFKENFLVFKRLRKGENIYDIYLNP